MSPSLEQAPRPVRRAFVPGFFRGLRAYFRVVPVLFRHRLWLVQFVPALLSLALSLIMFFGFLFFADWLGGRIDEKVAIPWAELDQFVAASAKVLIFLLLALVFVIVHKHVILVLLSPFLGKLAELTYRAVMKDDSTSPLTVVQSVTRGVRINLGNIFKEVFFNLCFLACNFIPVIGQVLAAAGLFLNQSRFMGYGLMDFPLEHRGLTVKESLRFINRRTGYSTGVGAGYIFLMLIPLIGWMFAPTFGTIAGTLVAIDELERERPASSA